MARWTVDQRTSSAIAPIKVYKGAKVVSRGTAFLVGPQRCLTALHVVADRTATPPRALGERIEIEFDAGTVTATLTAHFDARLDWALVSCAPHEATVEPPMPLPLSELVEGDDGWQTWGFPDLNRRDGKTFTGTLLRSDGTFEDAPVLELSAAGISGVPLSGLSGGPILIAGSVVGVIRATNMERHDGDARVVGDTVYATPFASIAAACGDEIPAQDACRGLPSIPDAPLPRNPFRYLNAFAKSDAAVFFGRCREIRALYDRITDRAATKLLALYGPTGVGKSSVLQAGVLPRLDEQFSVRSISRDSSVGMLQSCLRVLAATDLAAGVVELEAKEDRPVLLVLDQLEEIFTRPSAAGPVNELRELASAMAALVGASPAGKVLLGFRKEWLAEIEGAIEAAEADLSKTFLDRLDEAAICEIVEGLGRTHRLRERYRLEIEPGLGAEMAAALLEGSSPVAPTLQILLTRMWEAATKTSTAAPVFDKALYRRIARDGYHLREFLAQQLRVLEERCPKECASGLALDVLQFHVTSRGTSEQRTKEQLRAAYGDRGGAVLALAVEMKSLYLLADTTDDSAEHLDDTRLIHDTLAPLVLEQVASSQRPGQRASRILESRAAEWSDKNESKRPLDERDLGYVERGRDGMRAWEPTEVEIVEASRGARSRSRVKRGALFGSLFALATTAAVIGVVALASQARIRELEPLPHQIAAGAYYDDGRKQIDRGLPELGLRFAADALAMALDIDPRLPFYARWVVTAARSAPRDMLRDLEDGTVFSPNLDLRLVFNPGRGSLEAKDWRGLVRWSERVPFDQIIVWSADGSRVLATTRGATGDHPFYVVDPMIGKVECSATVTGAADGLESSAVVVWSRDRAHIAVRYLDALDGPARWEVITCPSGKTTKLVDASPSFASFTRDAVVYVDTKNRLCEQTLSSATPRCGEPLHAQVVQVATAGDRVFLETREPTAVVERTADGFKQIYSDEFPRPGQRMVRDVTADGARVLLAANPAYGDGGRIQLLDTRTGTRTDLGYGPGDLDEASFSSDESVVMATFLDGNALVKAASTWRVADGAPLLDSVQFQVTDQLFFARDGSALVQVAWSTARRWDIGRIAREQYHRGPLAPDEKVSVALFSATGERVYVLTRGEQGRLCAWDIARTAVTKAWCAADAFHGIIITSPSGGTVASLRGDRLLLLDARTGTPKAQQQVDLAGAESVSLAADDTVVVARSRDSSIEIETRRLGMQPAACRPPERGVFSAFDRDARHFLVATKDGGRMKLTLHRTADCAVVGSVSREVDIPGPVDALFQQRVGLDQLPLLASPIATWFQYAAVFGGPAKPPLRAGAWNDAQAQATFSDDGQWFVAQELSDDYVFDATQRLPVTLPLAKHRSVVARVFIDAGHAVRFITDDGDVSMQVLGAGDLASSVAAEQAGLIEAARALSGIEMIDSEPRYIERTRALIERDFWLGRTEAWAEASPTLRYLLDERGTMPVDFPKTPKPR